jgi:signal transduction histidine kinase
LLKKVLSNSDHLLSIVTGILEIARTKSGTLQLQPKICNVNQLIDTAISTMMPMAAKKGLSVTFLKPDTQQFGIYDAQKLIIILTNLLTNAAKFTEKGGIAVRLSGNDKGIEIIVSDTGLGINPDKMDSIYEEFTQLDYPKKHKPVGFGIGLSIVETMVETIQGELTISSAPGIGTAFTLFAPKLEG